MRTRRRLVALLSAGLAVGALGTATVGVPTARAASGTVTPGSCYAAAHVDADEVDLFSEVDCAREHAVQVLISTPLPKALAAADRTDLLTPGTPERAALLDFVRRTCTPAATAKAIYPAPTAKELAARFRTYAVVDWMPPAAGSLGWAIPDDISFADGTRELLCVHATNDALTGSSAGDIRDIATQAPVPTMRICQDFFDGGSRLDGVPCDGAHDVESLIWVSLDVSGKPDEVSSWTDADWKSLDEACRRLATVVIGAKRSDLLINADTSPRERVVDGTRFVNCRAFPIDEADAFAPGTIVTAAGKKRIATNPT